MNRRLMGDPHRTTTRWSRRSPVKKRCRCSRADGPISCCSTCSCRVLTATRRADGYANPDTAYLVVMVTASGTAEKACAIDAGADDFITKPLDQVLLGRVRSLLRVKRYHDTVVTQAAELAQWNRQLEARVAQQVERLDRYGRLRRFFSPTDHPAPARPGRRHVPHQSPARDHRGLLRPARVHRVRRDLRPGGGDVGARRIPPSLG